MKLPYESATSGEKALGEMQKLLRGFGCSKFGSEFDAIEPGSTGIHRCHYSGEWPKGHWWVATDDDLYPSRPVLFRIKATGAQP